MGHGQVEGSFTVLVEAPDAAAAEEVVTAVVERLGEAVAARHPSEAYPKFPRSWMTSISLARMPGEASAAVTSILAGSAPQGGSAR